MSSLISLLRDSATPRTFRAGNTMMFQGEIPRDVYIIQDGIVRSYIITSTGEERILSLFGKGDILPLAWALGSTNAAFANYQAVSDTRVLAVKKHIFDVELQENIDLTHAVAAAAGNEYTGLIMRLTGLMQARTIDKLGYTFYYLAHAYGLERPQNWTLINIKLNQTMLANMIGQTREGTARNLKALVEKKIVTYTNSSYSVCLPKLIALFGEDTFRELTR